LLALQMNRVLSPQRAESGWDRPKPGFYGRPSTIRPTKSCALGRRQPPPTHSAAASEAARRKVPRDTHQRGRQPRVQPPVPVHVRAQLHRHSRRQHLHHAAEGVTVLVRLVDLRDRRLRRVRVRRPPGRPR
jgi:hypothetical protein